MDREFAFLKTQTIIELGYLDHSSVSRPVDLVSRPTIKASQHIPEVTPPTASHRSATAKFWLSDFIPSVQYQHVMDRLKLDGKVAIITGSSGGIGKATAILFVQRGAKVVILGRDTEKLKAAKAECLKAGAKEDGLLTIAGDITKQDFRKEIIDKTVAKFKKIDILVNNAGVASFVPIEKLTEEQLDNNMNILFKAPFFLTVLAAPHLKASKGAIVNLSSAATNHPNAGVFAYAAGKRALETLTEFCALELTPQGIRVNTVRPGMIKTDMVTKQLTPTHMKLFEKGHLQNRLGEPYEIAEAVAFLASDAASFITGETLDVASGKRLHYNSGVSDKDFRPS